MHIACRKANAPAEFICFVRKYLSGVNCLERLCRPKAIIFATSL